jgi:hypothetical protein
VVGAAMDAGTSSLRLRLENGTQPGSTMSTSRSVSWLGSGCRCCPRCGWCPARPGGCAPHRREACIARIEGEVGTGRVGSLSRVSSRLLSAEPTRTTSRPNSDAGADVVGVVVGVDRVGHLVGDSVGGSDLVDRPLQVVPDARGRAEQHHALAGGQEGRLVGAVGDPVQGLLHPADEVALVVDGRAQRRGGWGRRRAGPRPTPGR